MRNGQPQEKGGGGGKRIEEDEEIYHWNPNDHPTVSIKTQNLK
jgi:hypothetical protein